MNQLKSLFPKTRLGQAILGVFILLLLCNIAVYRDMRHHQSVVSFDMKATVHAFTAQVAKQSVSQATKDREVKQFSQALTQVVQDFAKQHHVTVIVSPAIVAGAPDVTHELQQKIAAVMRGEKTA